MFTNRQYEILENALILVSEKGIQHLTIKNLASRMGVSEPALYRHFTNKKEILLSMLALFEEKSRNIFPSADNFMEKESDSLMQLETFFFSHLTLFEQNRTLASVVFSEDIFQNDSVLADSVFTMMEKKQSKIIELVSYGQERKYLRNDISAKQISIIIIGSLRFLITRWKLSGFAFNLKEEGEELWNAVGKILEP